MNSKQHFDSALRELMGEPPLRISQAQHILDKFATANKSGVIIVAKGLGMSRQNVHRWLYPRSAKGTGGLIPAQALRKLLVWARTVGVYLTSEDLDPRERHL